MKQIRIKGADLQRAALQNTDFSGSDLRFVNFFQANLDNDWTLLLIILTSYVLISFFLNLLIEKLFLD